MFSDSHQLKRIVRLVLTGFAVVAVEAVALWYLSGKIETRVIELGEKQEFLAAAEKSQIDFARLQGEFQKVEPHLRRLDVALPRPDELFSVVAEFNRLAENTGNRQSLVVEGEAPRGYSIPGILYAPFSAQVTGTYQSFRAYLAALNSSPYFMHIRTVTMSAAENINEEGKINITGEIFLRNN